MAFKFWIFAAGIFGLNSCEFSSKAGPLGINQNAGSVVEV